MIRFTLRNENLEPLITDSAIDINAIELTIKRGVESHGVLFQLLIDVKFIKEAREWLETAYQQTGGIDSNTLCLVEKYNPNTYKWQVYQNGKIDFIKRELTEDYISVGIVEGDGFQQRVLNALDTNVDLETLVDAFGNTLPATSVVENMTYHSKTILKQTTASRPLSEDVLVNKQILQPTGAAATGYALYALPETSLNEIAELLNPSDYIGGDNPVDLFLNQWKFKESAHLSIKVNHSIKLQNDTLSCDWTTKWVIKYGLPSALNTIEFGNDSTSSAIETSFSGESTTYEIDVEPEHILIIYNEFTRQFAGAGNYDARLLTLDPKFTITLSALTTAPPSTAKTILIWEAIEKILQYHTGQIDVLDSTLIGRTEQGYDEDGKWALIGFTLGKLLRGADAEGIQRSGKITTNLKYILKFLNSIGCIGYSFVTDENNITRFKLEHKSFFFDKTVVASLGAVSNPKDNTDQSMFYKSIKFGFSTKLENNEINSIDDFNTLREYNLPIKNTANKLDITSEMKVSGSQIEQQRRLNLSTEDSVLDDELFAISLVRDGGTFKPKKDEGYTTITNLYDSPTAYNLDFAPGRTIKNWLQYLASNFIRSESKLLKFSSGTTNFLMTTQKSGEYLITENGDIDFTNVVPLFDNSTYTIDDCELRENIITLVQANPNGAISFLDKKGNEYLGFIDPKGMEHNNFENKGKVSLLKVWQ